MTMKPLRFHTALYMLLPHHLKIALFIGKLAPVRLLAFPVCDHMQMRVRLSIITKEAENFYASPNSATLLIRSALHSLSFTNDPFFVRHHCNKQSAYTLVLHHTYIPIEIEIIIATVIKLRSFHSYTSEK